MEEINVKKETLQQEESKTNTDSSKVRFCFFSECIAFVCFVVLTIVMFVFHEPWYDEIQAWMVASDASIKEMIFELPHYEGHPPVWTLILALFAKTGVPMNVGLRIPTLIFSAIAAFLVIFKAPFHKWIRCLIPFGYFLFYQYTVICRPYSMMFLAFVLAAMFYKERNKKPIRYLLALYLLCVSSAYGILIAGVLCLIWTVEICKELIGKEFLRNALRDKRTWSLVGMLIVAVALLLIIWPADNAFAQVRVVEFPKLKALIYTFLILPADALVSDVALTGRLQQEVAAIVIPEYATFLCIGITLVLYVVLITAAHVFRKKAILILPYVAFAGYAALGYFYNHHIGIVPLFILFVFWCAVDDRPKELVIPKYLEKVEKSSPGVIKKIGYFFVILAVGMSIFWTVMAVKNDIKYPVWYAKDLAAMLKEYELTDYRILNHWTYQVKEDVGMSTSNENNELVFSTQIPQLEAGDYYQYPKMCNFVDILAYSDEKENYIYNFNGGDTNNRYVNHDMLTQEECEEYLHQIGEQGYPEVIIGNPEVLGMLGLDANEYEYKAVYILACYRVNTMQFMQESLFMCGKIFSIHVMIGRLTVK